MSDGLKATQQLIEAGKLLRSGKPRVGDLEALLERDVTKAERDEWYKEAKEPKKETKPTKTGPVRRRIVRLPGQNW